MQVLTERIRELDTQLQNIAETYLQGLTNQVAALQEVAQGFGGELNALPKKEVQTARLEREVTVRQELYTLLQTRLKEAEITQAMEDPSVRIVDPAVVPEHPVRAHSAAQPGALPGARLVARRGDRSEPGVDRPIGSLPRRCAAGRRVTRPRGSPPNGAGIVPFVAAAPPQAAAHAPP